MTWSFALIAAAAAAAAVTTARACTGSWQTDFHAAPAGWTLSNECVNDAKGLPLDFQPSQLFFGDPHANGGLSLHVVGGGCDPACGAGCKVRAAQLYPPLTSYGTYEMVARAPTVDATGQPATTTYFFMSLYNPTNGDQILFEVSGAGVTSCTFNYAGGKPGYSAQFRLPFDPYATFATWAIEWNVGYIVWSVNGAKVCEYTDGSPGGPLAPFFILRAMDSFYGNTASAQIQSAHYTCA